MIPPVSNHRILRLKEVRARVGNLSHTSIYEGAAKGTFPKPIKLGGRASGWLEHEIDAWIAGRIAARDASPRQAALNARPKQL